MTQLNLSGGLSNHTPQQKPATQPEEGSIKNQTVGALGALAIFAAVIVIGSCSRSSKPVAIQPQPIQPAAPVSVPPAAPAPAPVVAKAKAKKRRPATLSYVNHEYGISFSFPRQYMLKSGDAPQLSSGELGPFLTDFVHPGGVTLAALEMPANSYPGTDFKSGFVNLSVNPGMTAEACTQFAFAELKSGADPSSPEKIAKVKFGATEFSEVENSTAATMKPTDARYYHAFGNGACYEFALAIGTEGDGNAEGFTPVDRQAVFGKLERILASVKLQPAAVPQTKTPAASAQGIVPDSTAKIPEHSAIDRR
jgi:hypothetical protein